MTVQFAGAMAPSQSLDVSGRLEAFCATAEFDRPTLVLFSDSDPIFGRRAGEMIASQLPNAELDPPLEGAGHFLQEDRGELIAARIAAWLGG